MKKSMLALAACTCIAGAILTGCNATPAQKVESAQENVIEANKDLAQANSEYLADVEKYRTETATLIAANDQAIADFNAKVAHDKKAIKADQKKKMAELEQRNHDMKTKMENFKADGKEKWLVFKAEFTHDMDEMGKAFKDLAVKNVK